jgi:hypothetical protein
MRRAADAAADAADGKAAAAPAAAAPGAVAPAPAQAAPPLSADDWAAVARESFPATGDNEFRHLRLADFSDAVNALPREEVAAAMEAGGGAGGLQVGGCYGARRGHGPRALVGLARQGMGAAWRCSACLRRCLSAGALARCDSLPVGRRWSVAHCRAGLPSC